MKLDAELMASMRLETATIFSMRAYSSALVGWQTPCAREGGKILSLILPSPKYFFLIIGF